MMALVISCVALLLEVRQPLRFTAVEGGGLVEGDVQREAGAEDEQQVGGQLAGSVVQEIDKIYLLFFNEWRRTPNVAILGCDFYTSTDLKTFKPNFSSNRKEFLPNKKLQAPNHVHQNKQ